MNKLIAIVATLVVSLGLATLVPGQVPPPGGGPPPKAKGKGAGKKKADREPGGELRKAYDLLRRLRADEGGAGRTEERLRAWSDAAAGLYRDGLKAQSAGEVFLAREYGAAAHDLARAVDHARNAARFDRPDPDLPLPSDDFGLEDTRERARRDLYRAYERIGGPGTFEAKPGAEAYIKAARDLYNAARRDLEAGRDERAGELARAAEAMTHVPEHLAAIGDRGGTLTRPAVAPPPPQRERPGPKGEKAEPRPGAGVGLPPILPPE